MRPWVSTNLAISADGKISTVDPIPSGWTSRADHERLLQLRKSADALMVGRNTLLADRMTLTCPGESSQPLRCIVSRNGDIPADHPVFHGTGGPIHLLASAMASPPDLTNIPRETTVHTGDLSCFLDTLARNHRVRHLHCEGGGGLIRLLMEMDAIDEFHLTLAGHTLFGGATAPTATGIPTGFSGKSVDFEITGFSPHPKTGECFLSYRRVAQ